MYIPPGGGARVRMWVSSPDCRFVSEGTNSLMQTNPCSVTIEHVSVAALAAVAAAKAFARRTAACGDMAIGSVKSVGTSGNKCGSMIRMRHQCNSNLARLRQQHSTDILLYSSIAMLLIPGDHWSPQSNAMNTGRHEIYANTKNINCATASGAGKEHTPKVRVSCWPLRLNGCRLTMKSTRTRQLPRLGNHENYVTTRCGGSVI